MTALSYLHEPGVLWNLKCRYMVDDIYTYTGTILIAVNPFASLPHLYGEHMMDQYRCARGRLGTQARRQRAPAQRSAQVISGAAASAARPHGGAGAHV